MPATPPQGPLSLAYALLDSLQVLRACEGTPGPRTPEERTALQRFPGFGALALHIFPDPVTRQYRSPRWQELGERLQAVLTPEEYASALKSTFSAYYTSPLIITTLFAALKHLGIPDNATVLEPGMGHGSFLALAPPTLMFIGVELDLISALIAKELHGDRHEIRCESFEATRISADRIQAVTGNFPFADLPLTYQGKKLSLHNFFLAKSLDLLTPGGIVAVVTTHHTLDAQGERFRQLIAAKADFLGAVRLPAAAFAEQGTKVVTDLLFMQRRATGDTANHRAEWVNAFPMQIDGEAVPINGFFHANPRQVLGTWSRKDTLWGSEQSYSLVAYPNWEARLQEAIARLPQNIYYGESPTTKFTRHETLQAPLPLHASGLTEGSFFVGQDHDIYQVQMGEGIPVLSSSKPLTADGSPLGQRLAHLIRLRDAVRQTLHSQNTGMARKDRDDARQQLNAVYNAFVATYGPINKTVITATATGTLIRRMPNLVTFRDDPDCVIVMALEFYDEETGLATKAAIFTEDVVGHLPPVTQAETAEQALLICLDHQGRVNLDYIAQLTGKSPEEILDDLGDLLYLDPPLQEWMTADVYLSGNVRAKLAAAIQAGPAYARNVEALRAVQPEDILPGDIDVNLGAPWLPTDVIHAFACWLFDLRDFHITVAHSAKQALWGLYGSSWATQTIKTTSEYGTDRANGVSLLEQALNMKSPTIYDQHIIDGKEMRVLNQEETLAARDKQARIKDAFKDWVFQGPAQTEALVRLYNDLYNTIRLRSFDGSHLQFPGMSPHIQLAQHQLDGVWRIMSGGNTLLAHAVGAGKTYTMMASAMKMKQAGLIHKSLFAVPNHMLEQFSRECLQLYPNARLLMATKEDFTKERRKLLTAKMASGHWDGIITTHSSFERIGLSSAYQTQFLQEQIASYEALLVQHERESWQRQRASRNIIKSLEKQKARYQAKIEALAAEDKKDDGLVFDELGIDYLFIDESQYGKNLDAPTKMERVAGIQSGGSERAFDLYMKARYLHEQHPGRGITFASGTPISNTMVEMYTVQRYLDPDGLEAAGLEHFDAWAATFGEVVEMLEIAPDGKTLRPRSRFAKFVNLPELQQMFRSFADVQTAAMLQLPTPLLAGDKAIIIACPMSDEQRRLQDWLVRRYEDVRNGKVKPWEDNALAITTDGRKLAIDAQMLSELAHPWVDAKTEALADEVYTIWEQSQAIRGTQLVFCDLGVHPTAWGFSAYADVTDKLVKRGLPREHIAAVGEADTDGKKHALFQKVRQGTIRVLLGSTQKMGMGTNVQLRLIALHHLDAPWKPAEVEQREGRILRQGNLNPEVQIFRYVTEGSFDAFMWQALETKARFIAQVMSGQNTARAADDVSTQALSYAEVKAIASGNPAVLTLAQTDAALQRLRLLRKHHEDEQFVARLQVRNLPEDITRLQRRLDGLQRDLATAQQATTPPAGVFALDTGLTPLEEAIPLLGTRLQGLSALIPSTLSLALGSYRGLTFGLTVHPYATPEVYLQGATTQRTTLAKRAHGPRALLQAVMRLGESYEGSYRQAVRDIETFQTQLQRYSTRLDTPFPYVQYQEQLAKLRQQLAGALSAPDPSTQPVDTLVEQIAALHALHSTAHEAALRPAPRLPAPAAQAITTRIHALWASQQPESTLLAQPLLFRELLEDRGALRARAKRTAQPQTPTTQLRLL